MNARGIKYITNGLSNINFRNQNIPAEIDLDFTPDELYDRIEKIIISKIDDFVNHDLVNILTDFHSLKVGSSKFYTKIVQKLIDRQETLRPVEFIKFFSIFPELGYIYQNNMSSTLWDTYLNRVASQVYK